MQDDSKKPLSYEIPSSPLTRTHVRVILLLLLIQVVMTAQSSYAPGLTAAVKGWWAAHQQAAAHRKLVKQNEAMVAGCMNYAPPPTAVVWEEDPARAAKLLSGNGYHAIGPRPESPTFGGSPFAADVPAGAAADLPTFAPAPLTLLTMPNCSPATARTYRSRSNIGVAFLHGRKALGDIKERLVAVLIESDESLDVKGGDVSSQSPMECVFGKSQAIVAMSLPEGEDGMVTTDFPAVCELTVADPAAMPAKFSRSEAPGQPGKLTIDYQNQLRVFAGQAEPADASHFTISYDLDGQPGVIDGWLKANGSVVLEPRVGRRVNGLWYPHAK